jgi:hypothetical protein
MRSALLNSWTPGQKKAFLLGVFEGICNGVLGLGNGYYWEHGVIPELEKALFVWRELFTVIVQLLHAALKVP